MKSLIPILVACILVVGSGGGCGDGGSATSTGASARAGGPGGGERIEQFGSEAQDAERTALLASFRGYLSGIASRSYDAACANLAPDVQRSLEELVSPRLRSAGCATLLPQLLASGAGSVAAAQARGVVRKVRVEDDRGFVVFHSPGAELYMLPMTREGGSWRVALLTPSVILPSPQR